MRCHHCHHDPDDARKLDEILTALATIKKEQTAMFEELEAKTKKIVDAADAMDVVLQDVKSKLDTIIASGGMDDASKARLQAISDGLDKEADKIISDTLANTPAAPTA